MADLPAWVVLSLREQLTGETFVAQAKALGVDASITRDGIHLAGRFFGKIHASPFPSNLLDRSVSEKPLVLGAATLEISGGTNELERESHQQTLEMRKMAKEMSGRLLSAPPLDAVIESSASRKMMALTKLVHALAPLATAVIMPKANHIALDASDYIAMADEYLRGGAYTFPLWCYLKVRQDEGITTLVSTGMWPFGLPDIAMAVPEGPVPEQSVLAMGALQNEMVAEGWWPEDGVEFASKQGDLHLSRIRDAVWITERNSPAQMTKAARRRFARAHQMGLLLGEHTLHHRTSSADEVAIEHFVRPQGKSMAITNGLSDKPQPGGTAEDENLYIELSLTSAGLGPWANGWLDWASQYIQGHDGSHPIRPNDRLVLPEAMNGIAGVIVWPMGHLGAEPEGYPRVELWDLIPFLPDELLAFRSDPKAQALWMEQRLQREDIPEIQKRWLTAAAQ